MPKTKIKVVWSDAAKADLHYIYKRTLRKTKSLVNSTTDKLNKRPHRKRFNYENPIFVMNQLWFNQKLHL